MKKLLSIIIGLLMVVAFSTNKAPAQSGWDLRIAEYESTVLCPGGCEITITGKCCEPGNFTCNYVSCSNYTPPMAVCPSEC